MTSRKDVQEDTRIPRIAADLNAPRVLVLNASYEPLHVTSAKRAITLVQYGVAEILEDSADVVRSPSTVMSVPSVIRLRRYVRRPRVHPVPFNRRNVLRRDTFVCQYCGSSEELTLDHVLPRSRGGRHTWENVTTACRACNQRKGNRTPEEAAMPLRTRPRAPTFGAYAHGQFAHWQPQWSRYLGG
ncbi:MULTISPECIES: HNH endonuclease [unclassified Deinococcus]|jgi:5-methylcytosine-specific restriction endonuclease McrA|uniref:HNH endonuclease n=2 Tax=Deinococcus TaxID=1298 RepID=UPI0009945B3F|nr:MULTISPECIES: HNH endonuclease [unclassified Deinococcus]MBX8464271.1 HNH endonuclease [Deinococcus sp. RIT780]MCD0159171.1 HNH endonuclease [Deinococcus sp. 6GRE01]MCD0166703.1 HNH endonuclease [Deinococcus sp. 12RED42]MCD0176156.1 HNH endonuclease [Deinococcus sp. 14RED07]OOV14237.1 HNH endonuclease [Deinococcus sp. LM3]